MKPSELTVAVVLAIVAAGCGAGRNPAEPTLPPAPTATAEAMLRPTSTPRPTPTITTTPSPEVLTLLAWIDAFNHQDLEAFMSYVAENATLDRGPHGIVTGAQAIRETLLLEFEDPITAHVTWWSVDGNTITYGSYVLVGGGRIDSCTSLMVIENGRIVSDQCAP